MTMMNNILRNTLTLGSITLMMTSMAQKKNETSAAVEFKNKYLVSMSKGDYPDAKKALLSAKEFIDLSAVHEDTKDSPKTLYYKGEIYAHFMILGIQSNDTSMIQTAGENTLDVSIEAFKKGYEVSDKYDSDIKDAVYKKRVMLDGFAGGLYKNEKYKEAAQVYATEARYLEVIGELDSTALYNSALCYERSGNFAEAAPSYAKLANANYRGTTCYVLASNAYRKNGQVSEAKAIIAEGRKKYPSDRDLLLELVNTNIDANDPKGAEAALAEAISADPTNKQLHYTIGTIYIEMKQNAKAEISLNKALQIDPDYIDAQYQLGAHLVSWAGDIKTEANQLKFGDPNYSTMVAQADAIYNKAIIPLEKYITKNPKDKDVLNILFQINRSLGNSEKALEYKRKADAL
jgi:tetratricopeptide (TPR) repeat protein